MRWTFLTTRPRLPIRRPRRTQRRTGTPRETAQINPRDRTPYNPLLNLILVVPSTTTTSPRMHTPLLLVPTTCSRSWLVAHRESKNVPGSLSLPAPEVIEAGEEGVEIEAEATGVEAAGVVQEALPSPFQMTTTRQPRTFISQRPCHKSPLLPKDCHRASSNNLPQSFRSSTFRNSDSNSSNSLRRSHRSNNNSSSRRAFTSHSRLPISLTISGRKCLTHSNTSNFSNSSVSLAAKLDSNPSSFHQCSLLHLEAACQQELSSIQTFSLANSSTSNNNNNNNRNTPNKPHRALHPRQFKVLRSCYVDWVVSHRSR